MSLRDEEREEQLIVCRIVQCNETVLQMISH